MEVPKNWSSWDAVNSGSAWSRHVCPIVTFVLFYIKFQLVFHFFRNFYFTVVKLLLAFSIFIHKIVLIYKNCINTIYKNGFYLKFKQKILLNTKLMMHSTVLCV